MRNFTQPMRQLLLHGRLRSTGRPCLFHSTGHVSAQVGSGGEMAVDELQSRLKDKGLLQLQACIGGHWVSSKSTKSYEVRTSKYKQ